jgi:hypothetical protein
MNRSAITMLTTCLFAIAALSCQRDASTGSTTDPFVGFFAHPSSGAIELRRAGDDHKYTGSMWADFGPFPVEVTRDGDVARGTVTYGGAAHPLQLEHSSAGLILTADGTRADAPLQRYKDRQAYEDWFASKGGYQGTAVEIKPTTRPAR